MQETILEKCCVYEEEALEENQQDICYPDVREVIKQLAKTYDLYIVSNCQCGYIEQFLRKTQLEAYIKDIECFGNTGKNKGENIRLLVKRNSLKAPVYIGDTKGDCDASKEAGVPFIFASYGFGNVTEYAAKIGEMKELFEHHDEKPTNSFLYSLVMDTYSFGYSSAGFSDMPMNHKIFLAQFDAIKKLAGEGPCVMVGRCADYALADWKDCFSVFVHADFDWRINRIAAKYNKSPKEARDIITKTDKSRASYYNYYTNKKWGSAKSYNLCIDSSKYGIDNTVKAIIESIKIFDSTKASR